MLSASSLMAWVTISSYNKRSQIYKMHTVSAISANVVVLPNWLSCNTCSGLTLWGTVTLTYWCVWSIQASWFVSLIRVKRKQWKFWHWLVFDVQSLSHSAMVWHCLRSYLTMFCCVCRQCWMTSWHHYMMTVGRLWCTLLQSKVFSLILASVDVVRQHYSVELTSCWILLYA